MAFTYSKLDSELTRSSIWDQESDIRVVWITILSLKDKDGFVSSSLPGLAHLSRVSIDKAREALEMFLAPDEYSRTTDNEGRRIRETDGGWIVLNHVKYRDQQNKDQRKANQAEYARTKRANSKAVDASTSVDKRRQESTYTDTDTDTNTVKTKKVAPRPGAVIPDVERLGINEALWIEFLANRKRLKAANSPAAINTLINKIEKLHLQGHDANTLVETANERGWKSVFEPDKPKAGNGPTARDFATMDF